MGGSGRAATVHQVLTNEKYIGHNVYNRVSFKLKVKRVQNPPEMWVRRDGAFEAIVDERDFYTAQGIILERHRRLSDDEMLGRLRELLDAARQALRAHHRRGRPGAVERRLPPSIR